MTKIYKHVVPQANWGDPNLGAEDAERAQRFGAQQDDLIHGLTTGQIEQIHHSHDKLFEGREGQQFARLVGSKIDNRKELLRDALPFGKQVHFTGDTSNRQGQAFPGSPNGPGGSNSVFSTQPPMLPEFISPERQQFPVHRRLANCFVADTQVNMADGTIKFIQDVRIGDFLLDKDGNRAVVENAWSEPAPDELVKITAFGNRVFTCTPEHNWPAWVWPRKCACNCGQDVNVGRSFARGHHTKRGKNLHRVNYLRPKTAKRITILPGYDPVQKIKAGELKRGDMLLSPRGFETSKPDVPLSMARLLGYYAAGGCKNRDDGIVWVLHERERETIAAEIDSICNTSGIGVIITHLQESRALRVETRGDKSTTGNSLRLHDWLLKNAGEYSAEKKFSEEVFHWPLDYKLELLRGLFRGDGHQSWRDENKKTGPSSSFRFSYVTVSKQMAAQVNSICTQLGFALQTFTRNAFISKKGQKRSTAYFLNLSGEPARRMTSLIWGDEDKGQNRKASHVFSGPMLDDGKIFHKISKVERVKSEPGQLVYNLSVSGDHSYQVDGVSTYNSYWRLYKKLDPIVGPVIWMLSELAFGDFRLVGEHIDGSIKETLEYMCQETRIKSILPYFLDEYLSIGEAIIHLFFNNTKGIWEHVALHNPDQINVIYSPFIKMDPILEFVPDPKLREIVSSDHPQLAAVRKTMPAELVSKLRSGQNVPLSPTNTTFIPRKLHYYDLRGTSIQSRLWRVYIAEDYLWNAFIQTARRSASPIKILKVGDPASGVVPPPAEERRMLSLLTQAESDPQAWIVCNYMNQFELAGAPERLMSVNTHYDLIERIKLSALGVSKAFVSGDSSYQCFQINTRVKLADTTDANIQYIQVGEKVLDMNGDVQVVEASWCEGVPDTLVSVVVDGLDKPIVCTINHNWPVVRSDGILTIDRCRADELKAGDFFVYPLLRDGATHSLIKIKSVNLISNVDKTPVYNLTVSGSHSYLVEGGIATFNSAAAGLTVFLQREKAMREFFVNEWLIPKFFLPVAIANEWVKPNKPAAGGGQFKINPNLKGKYDPSRYILPKIEWAKSLDPQIDKEMIDAMVALKQNLGIKISDQKIYSSVGLESEDQYKKIIQENRIKKDLAGQDPEKMALLGLTSPVGEGAEGGGGGMGGGGAPMSTMPGIPPDAFGVGEGGEGGGEGIPGGGGGDLGGAPGAPGGGGEVGGEAPPAPEGASLKADEGEDAKPTKAKPKAPGAPKEFQSQHWTQGTIKSLVDFLNSGDLDHIDDVEPWVFLKKDKAVQDALDEGDKQEVWRAVQNWLLDENYPSDQIQDLEQALAAHGVVKKSAGVSVSSADLTAAAKKLGINLDEVDSIEYLIGIK